MAARKTVKHLEEEHGEKLGQHSDRLSELEAQNEFLMSEIKRLGGANYEELHPFSLNVNLEYKTTKKTKTTEELVTVSSPDFVGVLGVDTNKELAENAFFDALFDWANDNMDYKGYYLDIVPSENNPSLYELVFTPMPGENPAEKDDTLLVIGGVMIGIGVIIVALVLLLHGFGV